MRQLVARRNGKRKAPQSSSLFQVRSGPPSSSESLLGDRYLLEAALAESLIVGSDGGGQLYFARVDDRAEVSLYDPGQSELRTVATDLPTFVQLIDLAERAFALLEELELEEPSQLPRQHPAVRALRVELAAIASRISLAGKHVTSDFDEILQAVAGKPLRPLPVSTTETLSREAKFLVRILGSGGDQTSLEGLAKSHRADSKRPKRWANAGLRLRWLWQYYLLGQDADLKVLQAELKEDRSARVQDAVRLTKLLQGATEATALTPPLQDAVRARQRLSKVMAEAAPLRPVHGQTRVAPLDEARLTFLAKAQYERNGKVYTYEAEECMEALRAGDAGVFTRLLERMTEPLKPGYLHAHWNPPRARFFPWQVPAEAVPTLVEALRYRAKNLRHLWVLPSVIRALDRAGAGAQVPAASLLEEFEVAWKYGNPKTGSPDIVEATCEALERAPQPDAVGALVRLATSEPAESAALRLRQRALAALAATDWVPDEATLKRFLAGEERPAALLLLARRGPLLEEKARLSTVVLAPETAFEVLCRDPRAVDAARLALQSQGESLQTEWMHCLAIEALVQGQGAKAADDIRQVVRSSLHENVRRRATAALEALGQPAVPIWCDRAQVELAWKERGEEGLVALLRAECPVFVQNAFKKAAENGAGAAVRPHVQRAVMDWATHRFWVGSGTAWFDSTPLRDRMRHRAASLVCLGEQVWRPILDGLAKSESAGMLASCLQQA